MTEDTSPENLRKFLESDDPAMVRMGMSMAEGSGVPDELLPTILGLYMWDDDKNIRAAAKSVFIKFAPEDLKEVIKKKWKPRYRTMKASNLQDKVYSLFTSLDNDIIHTEALIKILPGKDPDHREWAVTKLGMIGDERAVEPLIENFELDVKTWNMWKRAGRVIENRKILQRKIAKALGQIGGSKAIEALVIISMHGRNTIIRDEARKSLKKLNYKSDERNLEEKWMFSNLCKEYVQYNYEYFDKKDNQIDAKLVEMISQEKRWGIPIKE
jgi:HEAT repeat protein